MTSLVEQTYAGLDGYRNSSVYSGHRVNDVRFEDGYGIAFDGNRTVYLSLDQRAQVVLLAIDTVTDEVKPDSSVSWVYLYRLFFDSVTSSLIMPVYMYASGRYNIYKYDLANQQLQSILPTTSGSSSSSLFHLNIGGGNVYDAVNLNGTTWLIVNNPRYWQSVHT